MLRRSKWTQMSLSILSSRRTLFWASCVWLELPVFLETIGHETLTDHLISGLCKLSRDLMCQDFATSAQLFSKQILTCAEHEPVGLPKTQHFHRFKTKESIRKIKPTYLDIFLEKKNVIFLMIDLSLRFKPISKLLLQKSHAAINYVRRYFKLSALTEPWLKLKQTTAGELYIKYEGNERGSRGSRGRKGKHSTHARRSTLRSLVRPLAPIFNTLQHAPLRSSKHSRSEIQRGSRDGSRNLHTQDER